MISEKIPNFSLDSPPTFSETLAALSKLKKGKACGPDGIEAEVLMALNLNNVRIFHEFITRVWTGAQTMPPEWLDSYTVPLPKKVTFPVAHGGEGSCLLLSLVNCLLVFCKPDCMITPRLLVYSLKHSVDFGVIGARWI